jgi:hypothetical protein
LEGKHLSYEMIELHLQFAYLFKLVLVAVKIQNVI